MQQNPIGLFDSGIGGTSIWKEITALLPSENTIYLSDSKNAPYGQKSKEQILNICINNTEFLLEQNCKLIVVACNTATTNAIKYLRAHYKIPFIGIEPAIKPAALKTKTNIVGVLATKGTLNSDLFEKTSSKIDTKVKIIEQIGEGLVELIENGKLDSKEMESLLKSYINPMLEKNADCLVLGCTHYPYLIPQIRKIAGDKITIIDSGEAVAKQTKNILNTLDLKNQTNLKASHQFYINTNPKVLEEIINTPKLKTKINQLDF
ncbi:MAG: glutamate racemase [Flavobacteriaceae bacterium]